jgi:hypothetical protein
MSEINDGGVTKTRCTRTPDRLHQEVFDFMGSTKSNRENSESIPQPLACYGSKESYPGYYSRIERERKTLNDGLTNLFGPLEKEAGFIIGAYGIYGSLVKSRRKWLEPPNWLVKPLPSMSEELTLKELAGRLRNLAGGNSTEVAAILKQAKTIENQVLSRSRLHAFGGLGIGLTASYFLDRLFFKHDELGNGSAFADLLAVPMLALRVPGNLLTKAGAIVVIEVAAKTLDHFTQSKRPFDPKGEAKSNGQARSQHSSDAPVATPLPMKMFSEEDRENQRCNGIKQQAQIENVNRP